MFSALKILIYKCFFFKRQKWKRWKQTTHGRCSAKEALSLVTAGHIDKKRESLDRTKTMDIISYDLIINIQPQNKVLNGLHK